MATTHPMANPAFQKPLTISPVLTWSLSITLFIFSVLPAPQLFMDVDMPVPPSDTPPMQAWRDPDQDGAMFGTNRIKEFPLHYGVLHVVPSMLWCILMPLQLSDSWRKARPRLHRRSGYVLATAYAILITSGSLFAFRHVVLGDNISYSHPDLLHVHRLTYRGHTFALSPTFDLALVFIAPVQAYTLFRAIRASRAKRYAEHRTWAIATAIAGYVIAIQRVAMVIAMMLGEILPRTGHGIDVKPGPETWEFEREVFAFSVTFAGMACSAWAGYVLATGRPTWSQESKVEASRAVLGKEL